MHEFLFPPFLYLCKADLLVFIQFRFTFQQQSRFPESADIFSQVRPDIILDTILESAIFRGKRYSFNPHNAQVFCLRNCFR